MADDQHPTLDIGAAGVGTAIALGHLVALLEHKGIVSLDEVRAVFANTLNALGGPMKSDYHHVLETIMPHLEV